MKVSIVIPVYNGEKYLSECIESCIRQDIDIDYEIIVINDGSTDKSAEIATSYDNVKVYSKNNGGTASALNMGIEMMQGEWFKWVSADDSLKPNALSVLMKYAERWDTLYYTDYAIIDDRSKILRTFHDRQYDHQAASMYHNFFGNGTTSLIHGSMFAIVGGFKEGMPYNDDYEFWLRWAVKFRFTMRHIPVVTANYRVHDSSLTSTKSSNDNQRLVDELRVQYRPYLTKDDHKYLKSIQVPLKRRFGRIARRTINNMRTRT